MQNYSNIQKFFHDFVLSNKIINKSFFELEKIIFYKNKNIENQSHVFITGLPRAGTTSILNFLFSTDRYASLTYNNMPFILSPNFSKLFQKKNIEKKERLHGDGINYDINSPEALDEIFFDNDEEFIKKELVKYIQLILLNKNKKIYLSKNNLNYKRINLIKSILPNSIFIIPIREPVQQANSLLNQHIRFCNLQKKDDFIRRYMNYLGHNEFGLNHRPWNTPVNHQNFNELDYWIEQWSLFYQNILNKYKLFSNCYFVIYEKLSDITYIENLLVKINLGNIKNIDLNYFKNKNKEIEKKYSTNEYKKAIEIYKNFLN